MNLSAPQNLRFATFRVSTTGQRAEVVGTAETESDALRFAETYAARFSASTYVSRVDERGRDKGLVARFLPWGRL
jgi:hypothetical protein